MKKKFYVLSFAIMFGINSLLAEEVTIDGMTYWIGGEEATVYSFVPEIYYAVHKDSIVVIPEYVEYGGQKYNVTDIRISHQMNGNTGSCTYEYAFNSGFIKKMIWKAKHCKDSFGYWSASSASGWTKWSGYDNPFEKVTIQNLVIEDNVEHIPALLFTGATILELHLGRNLKDIGAWSFCSRYKNNNITKLVLPDNLQSIGACAFYNLQYDTLIVGKSVKSIGTSAFSSSVTSYIEWNATKCANFSSDSYPFYSNGKQQLSCGLQYGSIRTGSYDYSLNIKTIVFGEEVEQIPAYLCSRMTNLKEIIIPCSVSTIGYQAMPNTMNCEITRQCGIVSESESVMTICEGDKLSWNEINIPSVKPSDSRVYEYKTKTVLYDDSIATLHLSVIPTSYTTLKDTLLCYEDDLILDGIKCNLEKSTTQRQIWSYTIKTIGGCDSVISVSVLWRKAEIRLPDTILCYNDDLILDGIKCPLTKMINSQQLWSYTLQTKDGCDSTVTISVTWRKLPDFTITTKDVYDTPNSGSISYTKADANYSGQYYCRLNGDIYFSSMSVLSEGNYRLVIYSMDECEDSIVKNIQINKYGMKINGMYYLLDEMKHTAKVTFRGKSFDAFADEYSGNITIPETVTFEDKEYQVTGIGSYAFSGCSNLKSITMESKTPVSIPSNCGLSNDVVIYVPYGSLNAYKNISNRNFHVINPSHVKATGGATSVRVTFGDSDEQKHIASCGMEGGETNAGNVLEYIGLEPKSEYANVPFTVNTKEGDHDILFCSFATSALTLNTLQPKAVSANTAILLAETNMSDMETSCGFEWRRNDQPEDMASNQVICPVANGLLAGRLKGLKDDVYYKYRAFYKSAAGNMYYGDWQYIFTGDATVQFEPVLYTYAAQFVSDRKATLKGYALAGSDDFTEQGFEYWAESRNSSHAPRRAPLDAIGEKHTVTGSGISMQVTLENLDEGTVYKYRTYAKTSNKTLYGSEMTFTTDGEWKYTLTVSIGDDKAGTVTGGGKYAAGSEVTIEAVAKDGYDFVRWSDGNTDNPRTITVHDDAEYTAVFKAKNPSSLTETELENAKVRKYIDNGILYIERNGITYTAQGQRID